MIFLVMKITIAELILPENHTSSEKSILWSVASLHSTWPPKIGFTLKYFTENILQFPKVRSDIILQKQPYNE
jgi:hypothetical protein